MTDNVTKFKAADHTTPEELKRLAHDVRILLEDIERGEILALSWVEHRKDDSISADWIKARGINKLEMIGGAMHLVSRLQESLKDKTIDDR